MVKENFDKKNTKTFNRLIRETIGRKRLWNYYEGRLDTKDILSNSDNCYNFIFKFINLSNKGDTIFDSIGLNFLLEKDPRRLIHIVSTYFLGLALLYDPTLDIKTKLYEELRGCYSSEKNKPRDMIFFWFLVSLFHDLGYFFEKDTQKRNPIMKEKNNILQKCDYLINPRETILNYFEYREKKDHGIYCGVELYNILCEIRKRKEKLSGLYFGKKLDRLYAKAASIIVEHNIYYVRETHADAKEYRKNRLEELILLNTKNKNGQYTDYRIKFKRNPWQFLFCLVDSIDPTKQTTLMDKVAMSFKKQCLIITTNSDIYANNIAKLNDWLCPVYTAYDKASSNFICTIHFNYDL